MAALIALPHRAYDPFDAKQLAAKGSFKFWHDCRETLVADI
jgi:hypothetical protein